MGLTLKALKKLHRDGKFQPTAPKPLHSRELVTISKSNYSLDSSPERSTPTRPAHSIPTPSSRWNEIEQRSTIEPANELREPAEAHSSIMETRSEYVESIEPVAPQAPPNQDRRPDIVMYDDASDHSIAASSSDTFSSRTHESEAEPTHDPLPPDHLTQPSTRMTDPFPVESETATSENPDGEPLDETWSRLLARSEPEPQPAFVVLPESPVLESRGHEFDGAEHTIVLGSDNGAGWQSSLDALKFSPTMVLDAAEEAPQTQSPHTTLGQAEMTSTTVPLAGLSDSDDTSANGDGDPYSPVIPTLEDELPDYLADQLNHLWKSPSTPSAASATSDDAHAQGIQADSSHHEAPFETPPQTQFVSHDGTVPEWDSPAPSVYANDMAPTVAITETPVQASVATEEPHDGDAAEVVPVPSPTTYEIRLLEHLRESKNEDAARQLVEQIRSTNHSRLPASLFCCSPEPTPRTADVLAELAMLLSEGEEDILLVDANLGDQTLTRAYEVVDTPGLCDVLNGRLAAWEIIRPTSRPHVWIVPAGDDTRGLSRNAEPIHHDVLIEVMKVWQYHFHRVLVDVGTIDATTAAPFARVLDASLMVVPQPDSKLASLRQAAQQFKALGSQPLGCVVTDGH